jgi:hypothetical protein
MPRPPYRALGIALRVFSVLFAIGGLFMIFGSRGLIIRVFLHPPEAEVSTLLLFLLKEMGGMVLTVSAMLFRASRDPERNVAVVDGLIVGLVILAMTPLLSLRTLDIQRIYPGHLVWGRSVIRLVLAAFFFYLRPRGAQWKPAGGFLNQEAGILCRGKPNFFHRVRVRSCVGTSNSGRTSHRVGYAMRERHVNASSRRSCDRSLY